MKKYSTQRVINEWNKLPNDCVNASSVNMFKNRIDAKCVNAKIVGFSISQWLPCPLAIWNLLFGMTILLNLIKSKSMAVENTFECITVEFAIQKIVRMLLSTACIEHLVQMYTFS